MTEVTEEVLRTTDLGLPEPAPEVLDRLEAAGHARHGFCEKCWGEAYRLSLGSGRSQTEEYAALLDELREG